VCHLRPARRMFQNSISDTLSVCPAFPPAFPRNRKDEIRGNYMQTKLDASSMLPVPLYLATRG
jgi:hypothetical protein